MYARCAIVAWKVTTRKGSSVVRVGAVSAWQSDVTRQARGSREMDGISHRGKLVFYMMKWSKDNKVEKTWVKWLWRIDEVTCGRQENSYEMTWLLVDGRDEIRDDGKRNGWSGTRQKTKSTVPAVSFLIMVVQNSSDVDDWCKCFCWHSNGRNSSILLAYIYVDGK